ncbi:MocR-like pyridoxine biosynthesis transcription factor PdxR [Bordetella genomosp. 11]|uniref:GntR family transcriptional regulator n=1 Tax=Bordetella genomosp. 11 TaxID=1416808 RepID=A0A261UGR5_9BORD|nr:PLP-dependent aminotransferase family protein [Bordetella genomosp. 11]OZI61129.1 GntR family transcriptional regulator [Bordetella genomosp. 11]
METPDNFQIAIDRQARMPLAGQIHHAIGQAIRDGRLAPGARLPSWRDLASQLGVARGTVRAAYERLIDEQLLVPAGAAGTFVSRHGIPAPPPPPPGDTAPVPDLIQRFSARPLTFQMGVPGQDTFPVAVWSRLFAQAAREMASGPMGYPDPRGEARLREQIAAYLALTRGVSCSPAQVLITAGYSGALNLVIRALGLEGRTAWMEDPGFPLTRRALTLAGMRLAHVPVDAQGLDVEAGLRSAPDAALAVVTPGQQAPLGVTMAPARRRALLDWAARQGAWVVEDDFLSELQLRGRAAPALAALDGAGRVLHIGTFSKTLSPVLRLGFIVVPTEKARHFTEVAACLAPAPASAPQLALAEFIGQGHYLRHLRRMKRLYAARRDALSACLARLPLDATAAMAGLAVRLALPDGTDDMEIARRALDHGLAPGALSNWYVSLPPRPGLMLAVSNVAEATLETDCRTLLRLIDEAR